MSGFFTSINGETRNGCARVNSDGTLDTAFNPDGNGRVFAQAAQADGKNLVGGEFTAMHGVPREGFARLRATDGFADSYDAAPYLDHPDYRATVVSVVLQGDGKVLVAGNFDFIGGESRVFFARLTNDSIARQNLTVSPTTVTWTRGGSSRQFARVTFENSIDGVNFNFLGQGSASGSNWTLTGLNLSTQQNLYVRARGYYQSSTSNGSESIQESVRNVFLIPDAPLRVISTARNGDAVVIRFDAIGARTYRLERTSSLAQPTTWTAIGMVDDLIPDISGPAQMIDFNSPNAKAFYRVRLLPLP